MTMEGKRRSRPAGIVVLCGGPGSEREVSLASGENAHQALLRAGVDNELVVVPAAEPERFLESLPCRLAVMMLHGRFGEDGTAQGILERRGIAFTGSDSAAAALAMSKDAAKRRFRKNRIPTPAWAVADSPGRLAAAIGEARLSYPLFVKPNSGGSSVGASPVGRPGELRAAAELALAEDRLVLAEEMVAGRELTVGWLDGRTLPIIELSAEGAFYDYRAKYLSEATRYGCPADLPEGTAAAVAAVADLAMRALGLRDVGRVDIMLGEGGPMALEVNALPGFTGHSLVPMAAAREGLGLEKLCLRLLDLAETRGAARSGLRSGEGAGDPPGDSAPESEGEGRPAGRARIGNWRDLRARLAGRERERMGAG
ncbi:MAG: D-alanine--D-alanine ligase [Planctomycetota bacterium]|jgi:D-alanine-D-alanine ligase|nr:D-alanine--D-alanine ligase [Planctomycetota bacterium]